MRADSHRGPERNRSTSEAEYIDAAHTFALSELHLAPHGRAIHLGTIQSFQVNSPGAGSRVEADIRVRHPPVSRVEERAFYT
jgi:hypothetical protein